MMQPLETVSSQPALFATGLVLEPLSIQILGKTLQGQWT